MLNKGLVRIFTAALTLVCLFYLSFTVVTSTYSKKASEYAGGDKMKEYQYLDSLGYEKVWLGYTLKECREREINLGLDLKGGMNVTLEVSVPDVIRSLSGYNQTDNFNQALARASELQKTNSQVEYLDLFVQAYHEIDPNAQLAAIFSTYELKDRLSLNSTNDEVIRVLREEIEGAVDNSFNVLRNRIDRFGVVQPNIQKLGNTGRILIELPGIKEPERVRKLLQGSANLEFWETYDVSEIYNNLAEANSILAEMYAPAAKEAPAAEAGTATETAAADEATTAVDSLKSLMGDEAAAAADNAKLLEEYKQANPLFGLTQTESLRGYAGPVVGYVSSRDTAQVNTYLNMKQVREVLPRDLGFRWAVKPLNERGEIFELYAIKITNRDGRAPLAGDVITDARADMTQGSAYASVSMSMNADGSKTWARMTKDNIGKCIAIVLDNYVYSAPRVNSEITGGNSQITGNFTIEEAKDLANTLNSGKMPAPARIIQEDIVGPSLGQQAIQSGFVSFVIAFVLILVYMVFYYGKIPGLFADLALFVNVFFLLGILASFSAVLTLPGIAGIVLTLGTAVDANVLIYERIREEVRAGKNQKRAVMDGFSNAISAIIDSNVTTVMSGIILMILGTGPIKGFATTLVIGTITSFVSAVFLTRSMLTWYVNRDSAKELSFTTNLMKNWLQNTHFDFMGKRKVGYIVSGVMIVICLVSFAVRGLSLGIDFSGGRNYVVRFDQAVQTEDVRELLEDAFEGAAAQVITIGSDNQVRISTKYKIDDNSETIDTEIEGILYDNLKPLLPADVTRDAFIQDYVQSSQKVGPTIADDIKRSAVLAIVFAVILIGLYIFARFRSFGYSLGAVIGLTCDALVTIGLYSLFYNVLPFSLEVDQSFIAAVLTIVGYTVNDKVVIFDRIRENVRLYPSRDKGQVINDAINATLSRTFSTAMSTLVVLIAIFIFGGETIRGFVFAILFGVIMGTYSSIFIASPVVYEYFLRKQKKDEEKALAAKKK